MDKLFCVNELKAFFNDEDYEYIKKLCYRAFNRVKMIRIERTSAKGENIFTHAKHFYLTDLKEKLEELSSRVPKNERQKLHILKANSALSKISDFSKTLSVEVYR